MPTDEVSNSRRHRSSLARNPSSALLRLMNWPIWLPIADSAASFFVSFPDRATEELDDSEGFGIEQDRENHAPVQPRSRCRRAAQEFGFGRRIDYPDWFRASPNLP